jgi:hypothetical protein
LIADADPGRIDRIRILEAEVTAGRAARRAAKGQEPIGDAAWFQGQSTDADGVYQSMPIDEAVLWSRTARGGRQLELLAADPADAGCMRWGLCETDKEPT